MTKSEIIKEAFSINLGLNAINRIMITLSIIRAVWINRKKKNQLSDYVSAMYYPIAETTPIT